MFNLPKNTLVNKFIPKSTFYNRLNIATSVKDEFTNKIDKITWKYKLSEETLGITKTSEVEEIQIFEIELKEKMIPRNVIKIITKNIVYAILFKLIYKEEYCYLIKLEDDIYTSNWNEKINFDFSGINLSIVYQKIIKSIIKQEENNEQFNIIIEKSNKIKLLEKEISLLENKLKQEKQFNRRVEINNLLLNRKKELEDL
jgi:hypothetical protein